MNADLLLRERLWLADELFVDVVIWRVPQPVPGSSHTFKYRLALVSAGVCILRYDNEAGKGDHKHIEDREVPYRFIDPEALLKDFRADVEEWRAKQ